MNNRAGPQLPEVVYLPAVPELDSRALRKALGVSRAVLSLWRGAWAFPPSQRSGSTTITDAAAVAAWLTRHRVAVQWV